MKTNKSFLKRVKITRRGKVLARQSGQNHFQAKARRAKQLNQKKLVAFELKNKILGRYLSSH
ncbi:MAG: 50S ribosomal protein L35 [Candidatus Vogelbacteria bacterium]|nr:50S ribosomal protein L35 [Candidatus Vogelbacteria bacterium]